PVPSRLANKDRFSEQNTSKTLKNRRLWTGTSLVLLCHKMVVAAWTSWQPPRQGVGESNPDGGD
ncbi:hypothetical protein, partial [Sinorhizobium meliloti]|uniref:hypothetical protein n=1 Tax=Rhizobium meliloti TaxID=382 RepID=UPI001AEC8B3D